MGLHAGVSGPPHMVCMSHTAVTLSCSCLQCCLTCREVTKPSPALLPDVSSRGTHVPEAGGAGCLTDEQCGWAMSLGSGVELPPKSETELLKGAACMVRPCMRPCMVRPKSHPTPTCLVKLWRVFSDGGSS